MKKKFQRIGIAGCMILAFACTKSGPVLPTITDVYVSGDSVSTGFKSIIKYWKNGIQVNCSDGTSQGFPTSIAVSGSNVYLAGALIEGTQWSAMAWKNGAGVKLSTGIHGTLTNSVKVSGNDVYYGGSVANTNSTSFATYWKNGIPTTVSDGKTAGYVQDMAIKGSDVYLLIIEDNSKSLKAGIWKNGVLTNYFTGTGENADFGQFYEMTVNDSDVYLAATIVSNKGYIVAGYFKNGVPVTFSDSTVNSYAASIDVVGKDVYVAGLSNKGFTNYAGYNRAAYWKNGAVVFLTDGSMDAGANSIKVIGTDVYAAGFMRIKGVNQAIYWKNGVPIQLSHATNISFASKIVIVQH